MFKNICALFPFSSSAFRETPMMIIGRGGRNRSMLSEMKMMGDVASRLMRTQNAHPRSHRSFCLPVTHDIKTWHNRCADRAGVILPNTLRVPLRFRDPLKNGLRQIPYTLIFPRYTGCSRSSQ